MPDATTPRNNERFLDWIVYEIYPRSFYDSNGDGIGDLNGIREKIPHLVELGVNAVWLCPCYKSPNADNGYDVADYRDISADFGTLEDWKSLIAALHEKGIKLIMDLVANHTSSEHEWFRRARSSRNDPYHDYYIWSDKPRNRWQSVFGGSAWEYNEATDEYYLHSFAVKQPDLNWENPKVRKEIRAVVDYWIALGVDGFRCDVLDFISKDFEKGKMSNGPRLHAYIRELFGDKTPENLFTVGECEAKERDILLLCGKYRNELSTSFQFEHMTEIGRTNKYLPRPFSYSEIKNVLVKWQEFTQTYDVLYTLLTDNHDQPYFLSRLGEDGTRRYECATMYAAMFFLLRGIPFLYQTQEYGAINPRYDDVRFFDDVETRQYYRENENKRPKEKLLQEINYGSRDNSRHPFAWNGDKASSYGFSTGKPWLIPHSRAEEINLEKDKKSQRSVFAFYKKVLALRKDSEAVRRGTFRDRSTNGNAFFYERKTEREIVLVVCNFDKPQTLALPQDLQKGYTLSLTNFPEREHEPFSPHFAPFETAVYRKNT